MVYCRWFIMEHGLLHKLKNVLVKCIKKKDKNEAELCNIFRTISNIIHNCAEYLHDFENESLLELSCNYLSSTNVK